MKRLGACIFACVFPLAAAGASSGTVDRTPPGRGDTGDTTTVQVMVELEDLPTVRVYADALGGAPARATAKARARATGTAQAHLARVEGVQRAVSARLESADIAAAVLYRVQRVYNGIAIQVDRDRLDRVADVPGVRAVHPILPVYPRTSTSVPFIGAPAVWGAQVGATGDGVSIGVIDSGVDYIHADLGGSGSNADYLANDTTTISDGFFPNAKVVGGWDFVGDDYNGFNEPVEDPDPMDCSGHGTRTAGIAAGYGVAGAGAYTGPYDETTPVESMSIGPGVAPEARVYSLRVFGCVGPSGAVDRAIDWAVDPDGDGDFADRLDVINLSLGTLYGSTLNPPTVAAANNAALAGVIVVAAAGNDAEPYYIIDSPGSAARAISVAASLDRDVQAIFDGVRVNSPGPMAGDILARRQWFGANPGIPGITADIVMADPYDGCAPLHNAAAVAGKVVLVDWRSCAFDLKVANAQNAGAVAVLLVPEGHPGLPFQPYVDADLMSIPVYMVREDDGHQLVAAGSTANVTLTAELVATEPDLSDTLADFSSRGPSAPDSYLKPDIAAPGVNITSARAGTGNDETWSSGTSVSTPHVAGAMALLRQLHPGWTEEELKALVMNTAQHDLSTGPQGAPPIYRPGRAGVGRIDVSAAARSQAAAFATEPPGLVHVSFGLVEVAESVRVSRTVNVVNRGATALTFQLSYHGLADVPGVDVALPSSPRVTVAAGSMSSFDVELTADIAQLRHVCEPTAAAYPYLLAPDDLRPMARHCVSEEEGFILLTPESPAGDQPPLRLVAHAVVRPVAAMVAAESSLTAAGDTSFTLHLRGRHLDSGSAPPGIRSAVSVVELVETSPNEPASSPDFLDLRYVGVASDFRARTAAGQGLDDTVVSFAVVTHDSWTSPTPVGVRIWVDADRDGSFDVVVYPTPVRTWQDYWSDVMWVAVVDLTTGLTSWQYYVNGVSPAERDTVMLNGSAMVLPVRAADLGLRPDDPAFNFHVEIAIPLTGPFPGGEVVVDAGATHTYDPTRAGLHVTGSHLAPWVWDDLDGATIPVQYDHEDYEQGGASGLLLIHHHNRTSDRAQVVEVNAVPGQGPRRPRGRHSTTSP